MLPIRVYHPQNRADQTWHMEAEEEKEQAMDNRRRLIAWQ